VELLIAAPISVCAECAEYSRFAGLRVERIEDDILDAEFVGA
jgi:hypothetical protein